MKKIFRKNIFYKGFTLVELMIVIAIIGILASVLYPSITGYFERARDTAKKQKAYQISLAINTFYTDNGTYKIIPGFTDKGYWLTHNYNGNPSIIENLENGGYIKKGYIKKGLYGKGLKTKSKICTGLNKTRPYSEIFSYAANNERYRLSIILETSSTEKDEINLRDNLHNGRDACLGVLGWTNGADNYGIGN